MSAQHHVLRWSFCAVLCAAMVWPAVRAQEAGRPLPGGGPFTRVPVLNAPFTADAITTITRRNGTRETWTARYYRDPVGRVRAERTTPHGNLVVIDTDPGDRVGRVALIDTSARTLVPAPVEMGDLLFNSGTYIALPLDVKRYAHLGSCRTDERPRYDLDHTGIDECSLDVALPGARAPYDVLPDLQLVSYSRRRHSRSGIIEYRLENLRRVEPPAELFELPSDFAFPPPGLLVSFEHWSGPSR